MLSFHEIMKVQYCSTRIRVKPNLVNWKLPKVKQAIIDYFKKGSNGRVTILQRIEFKANVTRSEYLDLIENEKHRQAVAKLGSSNHN